ncbi:MAG: 2-oxoacid:acceptor oxidoreductase family protein [Endomicrobium sp.]|jgi:2-oxoglutarate ferredoxin oxidoreductase subunit gamma|nr:2-oxoacid:acceptor oxidoreductase family protein [Endomicrobium sp.]
MKLEIIITGFGGQGVLSAGILIAQAAMEQNLHTTWFPSYGAEMRGGLSNSTVVVSSDEIGSPFVFNPDVLIVLNELSLNKFKKNRITDKTIIIVNSHMISTKYEQQKKTNHFFVPATNIANSKIKNFKTTNTVIIGAFIKVLEFKKKNDTLFIKNVLSACETLFAKNRHLTYINKKAIIAGYNFIKEFCI